MSLFWVWTKPICLYATICHLKRLDFCHGSHEEPLVQPNQKHRTLARASFRNHLLGAFVVVVEDADANPPASGGAGEAQHLGGAVAAGEVVGELGGNVLVEEAADLHGPLSAGIERSGRRQDFHFHFGGAGLIHVEPAGGGERKIENAAGNERSAIGDAYQRRVRGLEIRDANDGTERQSAMRGGHGVHVVDFAVRSAAVVVRRSIPAGHPGFGGDRSGTRRDRRLGQVGIGGGFCILGTIVAV